MKNIVTENGVFSPENVAYLKKENKSFDNIIKHPLVKRNHGLCTEDSFHEILSLERRRTERSGKAFLLMLLDISTLLPKNEGISKDLSKELTNYIRDIDTMGWYKSEITLGIIFTEINKTDICSLKEKINEVLINTLDLEQLKKININCNIFPEDECRKQPDSSTPNLRLYPDLSKQRFSKRVSFTLKRTLDIIGSTFAILIFSPFFLIIMILIKLSSEGPIMFKQQRVGKYGKEFTFLKFRTMHVDNDDTIHREYVSELIRNQKAATEEKKEGGTKYTYKLNNDPRVTPIGSFLRKTSLDELPQFLNVLKGDMSLVGPRPPIPYELEDYDIWHNRRVLEVKPGITGVWQTEGRSSTTFDEMVRMDIKYIKKRSIWMDIKILLKTPWTVLTGKGAR